jgi:hypothetical protein
MLAYIAGAAVVLAAMWLARGLLIYQVEAIIHKLSGTLHGVGYGLWRMLCGLSGAVCTLADRVCADRQWRPMQVQPWKLLWVQCRLLLYLVLHCCAIYSLTTLL